MSEILMFFGLWLLCGVFWAALVGRVIKAGKEDSNVVDFESRRSSLRATCAQRRVH